MNKLNQLLLAGLLTLPLVACDDPGGKDERDEPVAQPETPASPKAPDIPKGAPSEPSIAQYAAEARTEITPENVDAQAEALEQELQAELAALEE